MTPDRLGHLLDRRAPALARVLRPAWRAMVRRGHPSSYWRRRAGFAYYRAVVDLARAYVPPVLTTWDWETPRVGRSVLDVGARDTEVLRALDWFPRRVAIDLVRGPAIPGIAQIRADFLTWTPPYRGWDRDAQRWAPFRFDLVLCLQVLEHLENPAGFCRKLFETGRVVIISVPYRWPAGTHPDHVQDPVDETTLIRWAGQSPRETRIVRDERDRLIAVFEPEVMSAPACASEPSAMRAPANRSEPADVCVPPRGASPSPEWPIKASESCAERAPRIQSGATGRDRTNILERARCPRVDPGR
jgi:hypothetical protein